MVKKTSSARAPRLSPPDSSAEPIAPPTLPHAWTPYPWQARVFDAFERGIKRFLIIVHRRAGKDQVCLNLAAIASQQRVGLYLHIFPYANQVRRAIWRGMDKSTGVRFVDQAFPEELRTASREALMEIEFHNGSIWHCMGSDNREALRGANPVGVVMSEYAFCNPEAWQTIAPILRENGGWAAFVTTPFGKNHAWKLYETVKDSPDWHVEYLTVEDTEQLDGSPIITPEMIDAERRDGMDEASIRQEYYCDWEASFKGAYFAAELATMRAQHRICKTDAGAGRRVFVAWHLGHGDQLLALAFQNAGAAHYCIGSRSWPFASYETALDDLAGMFPGSPLVHLIPPNAAAAEAMPGAQTVAPLSADQAIPVTRALLPTLWIDNAARAWAPDGNNSALIDALGGFRAAETDPGMPARRPLLSWESTYVEALALYAAGNRAGAVSPQAWGPAPNYAAIDKCVI